MHKYLIKKRNYFILSVIVSILYSIGTASVALVLASIIDAASGNSTDILLQASLQAIFFVMLYVALSFAYERIKNSLLMSALFSLKSDVFMSIMKKNINDFEKMNSAAYINELTTNVNLIEDLYFSNFFSLINLLISFSTAVVITIYYQPFLLIIMAVLGLITTGITKITGKNIDDFAKNISDRTRNYQIALKEYFIGFRVIKAFSIKDYLCIAHDNKNNDLEISKLKYRNKTALVVSLGTLIGFFSTILIMTVAAGFAISGLISIGTVFAVGHLMGQVTSPISALPQIIMKFKSAKPIKDELINIINYHGREEEGVSLTAIKNKIQICDLNFAYKNKSVFEAISVSFEIGKKYAIVGASGCGKTTLLSLLLGHYDHYTGRIMYDKQEVRNIKKTDIYKTIGVIFQETFLFDDTIRNNVTLFDESFTDDEIINAVERAGIKTFINEYPDGLDGRITENGKNISGGERQRISLARVFLRKQKWLFLDEFTANLDSGTAFEIEHQVLSINETTVLAITHRLNKSLLMKYDNIVVIKDHKIIEFGHFSKLLEQNGYFNSLMMLSSDV